MEICNKKLLFSGTTSRFEKAIKEYLDDTAFLSEFCSPEEAENVIKVFLPDLILTSISASADYTDRVQQLKDLSLSLNIPFAVIVNRNEETPYLFLVNSKISNILTSPVSKEDFIQQINKFMPMDDPESVPGSAGEIYKYSNSESSLISNLVIQNRMVKDFLKNKIPSAKSEKIHSEKINEQRIIEKKLWEALDNNYFRLYYQPVISLETGKLSGFESLIRIVHPEEGLIPPGDFISVAENSAVIFPLGLWIIEEACRQINIWKEEFVLDDPLRININLSANQFIHPDLTSHIFEITERLKIEENDIAFELTESAFMEDMESANIALLELRSRKFTLYMDDFGTGYSSLSYLMHFPVNVIKIDQSFVKWMHIDEQSETLVKSLVALAHNLGLKVVAEGTDDESHIDILKSCGCDYAQGYYYAKPLPAPEAAEFISGHFRRK